jgi:hypothetical protein
VIHIHSLENFLKAGHSLTSAGLSPSFSSGGILSLQKSPSPIGANIFDHHDPSHDIRTTPKALVNSSPGQAPWERNRSRSVNSERVRHTALATKLSGARRLGV